MAERIVGRMPLWVIFFIASSGVFVALSFPFDIFSLDFKSGLVLTNMTAIEMSKSFDGNFKPFIMVNYLGESFPSGIIEIVLLSFVTGILVYLCYDVYAWMNHKTKILIGYLFPDMYEKIASIMTRAREHFESESGTKPILDPAEFRPFAKWLRDINQEGHVDILQSLKMMTEGLLYGTETFLLFNIARISNVVILFFIDGMSELSRMSESGAWLVLSILFVLASYGLFKLFPLRFNRAYRSLIEDFRKAQDHPMRGFE